MRLVVLLSILVACGPKSSPEDQAFEQAQVVVAAFERGDAAPQPLPEDLQALTTAQAYLGEYLWEMDAAMQAAAAAVPASVTGDPRFAGLSVAVPAPEGDGCCFLVHFPARVDGQIVPWVVAKAGWDATSAVNHNADPLPEVGAEDAELAARVALLDKATAMAGDGFGPGRVVAMGDLTHDPDDDDVRVYFAPAVPADQIGVGGLVVKVWEDRAGEPLTLTLGGEARTWPRDRFADDGPGLFLQAPGRAPDEAHVLASRRYDLPLWVDLDTGLWRVEGNGVGLYGTKSP